MLGKAKVPRHSPTSPATMVWPFPSLPNSYLATIAEKRAERAHALKTASAEELSYEETQIVGSTGEHRIALSNRAILTRILFNSKSPVHRGCDPTKEMDIYAGHTCLYEISSTRSTIDQCVN